MTQLQLTSGTGISYSYDFLGRVVGKNYIGGMNATWSFDQAGRPTNLIYSKNDGTTIYTQANTFDGRGNILQKVTGSGTTIYTYDKAYQLIGADHPATSDEQFTYDPVGNRLTSTDYSNWSYNNRNELGGYGGVSYSYDQNGNTISKSDASGTTNYQYNYENRMIRVDLPGGGYATYKYDTRGRRIEKNVGGVVTRYFYDGNMLLAEYDATGNLQKSYFYGTGDFNPSILAEGGQFYFYVKNHLDTPQKVVNEGGGDEWVAEYTSFGGVNISVNTVTQNFRFPGQYWDNEAGLNYNFYRYYDSGIGRYSREDPIGYQGGLNLFVYVSNNPINLYDFLGLKKCSKITIKRKNIHITADDKYGHWWVEMGSESYGWWPKYGVGLWDTLTGIDGELNGQTTFGGTSTTDPHHGDTAEESFHPTKTSSTKECKCMTCKDVTECIRKFAKGYSGSWSWPWGQNCHSFQTAMMKKCCLKK